MMKANESSTRIMYDPLYGKWHVEGPDCWSQLFDTYLDCARAINAGTIIWYKKQGDRGVK